MVDLWQRRAEAITERRQLEEQLVEVSSEISFFDRLLFFHHTENESIEERIKQRLRDLSGVISSVGSDINAFWDQLSKESPDFKRVRGLEEVLRRSLVAQKAHELKFALDGCRVLLESALEAVKEPPTDLEPEGMVSRLFSEPGQAYLVPLASLTALLQLATPLSEGTWHGSRSTLAFRPLLVFLVSEIMTVFRKAEPENMFPSEEISTWIASDHPAAEVPVMPAALQSIYATGESREPLADLGSLFEKLAGHDLALRLTRRQISTFDRIVFWSDTPAESHEKTLLADREGLCDEIAESWDEFDQRLRRRRRDSWELYVADQALAVRDSIRAIATDSGESSRSKSCPLLNQEPAARQIESFANEVSQRYGQAWKRDALLQQALTLGETGRGPLSGELVPLAELPGLLGPRLVELGYPAKQQAILDLQAEVQARGGELKAAQGQISTWDRLNMFKETEAEASEKVLAQALTESTERCKALALASQDEFETLLGGLHQPALVGLLLDELGRAVDEISAVCASYVRNYEDNEGEDRQETVYYCTLRGIEEAGALLVRLLSTAQMKDGDYFAPLQSAEVWALLDSEYAKPIHALAATTSA